MTQTVICMKWGVRYGPEYVNRLYSMIQRHTTRPTRLVCYTDSAQGIAPGIETYPLPYINLTGKLEWQTWRKISLWQKALEGVSGEVLFMDLDMVVTGNLDCFFDFKPGHFCVIKNWSQPKKPTGNTSMFRFTVGAHPYIYDRFVVDCFESTKRYRTEQAFISGEITDIEFFPDAWCLSFKHNLLPSWPLNLFKAPPLPVTAKVVAFTGKPDQDDALAGRWPRKHWYQFFYKRVRPTPWIAEHWR